MTHLTVEEIIDFVSFDKLTEENIALSKKVNEHICSCKACFDKVTAFQSVYEEFQRIGTIGDAKQCIYRMIDSGLLCELQENEVQKVIASLEDWREEVIE